MFFVYLGSLDNPKSVGTNNLIKEFAKIATCPEDIIKNYDFLHILEENKLNLVTECDVEEEFKDIYKLIVDKPIDINDIVKLTNKSLQEVMQKLIILEIEGKVKKIAGNRYIRSKL